MNCSTVGGKICVILRMLRRGLNGGEEALQYPTRFPARTMVASIVFAAAVIGGFEPLYLRMIVADRDALRASAAAVADRDTPQYATFLEQVRARTPTGASIAILAPVRHWQDGYDYWYYRACYILHGVACCRSWTAPTWSIRIVSGLLITSQTGESPPGSPDSGSSGEDREAPS